MLPYYLILDELIFLNLTQLFLLKLLLKDTMFQYPYGYMTKAISYKTHV